MKFTLISDNEYGGPKITYEFEEDFLESVVENFEQFLKGSGFVFESLEVNQAALENSSWDTDDDFGDDDEDAGHEFFDYRSLEKSKGNGDVIKGTVPENNMSTVWPFPMNRPQDETVSVEPSEK